MAIIIKTALLASLSAIFLTDSTTPVVKAIDLFAKADDSVDGDPAQVYISDDNSDDNDAEATTLRLTRKRTTIMKRRKQAGLILNILVMQTITLWWTTKTSLV